MSITLSQTVAITALVGFLPVCTAPLCAGKTCRFVFEVISSSSSSSCNDSYDFFTYVWSDSSSSDCHGHH